MSPNSVDPSALLPTSSWYLASQRTNAFNVAQTAFEQSLAAFKRKLRANSKKGARLEDLKATRLQDVIDEIIRARAHYDSKNELSKARQCIVAFSKRVGYYGQVMDVMVQHHPEYVSLAWGTMKIIFGSIVEHERLGVTIVTALSDIGDALSRIELAEALYPTEQMRATIATLNCHIITFLLRALEWYESKPISRAIQSVTKPAALRYDDVIEDIKRTLGKVNDLSVAGSQAEQRDMHDELRQIRDAQNVLRMDVQSRLGQMQLQLPTINQQQYQQRELQQLHQKLQEVVTILQKTQQNQASTEQTLLQEMISMKQDIKATQASIRHQLSDIQLTQALSIISDSCAITPKSAYENALLLRRVRKVSSFAKCAPFWNSQQLQSWDQSPSHSSIVLRAAFRDRLNIRDFRTSVIEQLLRSEVAVLWVLQQKNVEHNICEVLKSLIFQALNKDSLSHTDIVVSSYIRTFNAAHSLDDYVTLLASILAHFKFVYIVIDSGAISSDSLGEVHRIFAAFPQLLSDRSPEMVLKVMFLTHRLTEMPTADNGQGKVQPQKVLRVGQTSKRKSKRIPQAPLRGKSKLGSK